MTTILQPLAKKRSLAITRKIPKEVQSSYGVGLSYTPEIDNNVWRTAEGEAKIEQSLYVILSTPVGSRFMQPDFGSMLPLMVFAGYDAATRAEIKRYTLESIRRWEPRVKLMRVHLDESSIQQHQVGVQLEYTVVDAEDLFYTATIPIRIENNSIQFMPPGLFKVHGKDVF